MTDGVVKLDAYSPSDVEAQLAGDDFQNQKWLNDYNASTAETVTRAIEQWQQNWTEDGHTRTWAIRNPENGRLLGGCEIQLKEAEIGHLSYWVFPESRGKGYAARALHLIASYAFQHLGVARAEVYIDAENSASLSVARRAGFRQEGILRQQGKLGSERRDMIIASRLPGEA